MPSRVDAAILATLGGAVPPLATLPASRCGSLVEVLVLVLLVGQCDWRASKYPLMHGQIFQTWGVIEPVVYLLPAPPGPRPWLTRAAVTPPLRWRNHRKSMGMNCGW